MVKEYEIKELEKLLGKTRTSIMKLAKKEEWRVVKKKVGRTHRNFYVAEDVDGYINSCAELAERKAKSRVRTVPKREATVIDELPEWNQKVAKARYTLCMNLEEKYKTIAAKKELIIKEFVKEVYRDFPAQMEILKKISLSTLRRWYGVYIKNKTNPLALSSGHGSNKGMRRIDEDVLTSIKALYLNKNKPDMMFVYESIVQQFGADAISYGTLRNYIKKDLNIIEVAKGRMGPKEFKDTHGAYVIRDYGDIKAGEWWMSDGHDLEIICYRGNRKKSNGQRETGSPKLIVWIDVKSRFVTGWHLSWEETTESIAMALKNGIERYGVPDNIYTDNGKAYRGKILEGTKELEGIYGSLGIGVSHALPLNAQAKHVERWFLDFKKSLMKRFEAYKGGNIMERPEAIKGFALKKLPETAYLEEDEVEAIIGGFIEYKNHEYYNLRREAGRKAHRGRGMNNRTPLEVFDAEYPLKDRKLLSNEQLRLLFLYEDIRVIQQNGIEFMGNIYAKEQVYFHQKERVKIKYDPHDLSYIYVYLLTGEFLCKADKLTTAGWNDVPAIKEHKKRVQKLNKHYKQITAIREEERELSGVIDYNFTERETEVIENKKAGQKQIYLGDGLYQVIDEGD